MFINGTSQQITLRGALHINVANVTSNLTCFNVGSINCACVNDDSCSFDAGSHLPLDWLHVMSVLMFLVQLMSGAVCPLGGYMS